MKILLSLLTFQSVTLDSLDAFNRRKDLIPEPLHNPIKDVLTVDADVTVQSVTQCADVAVDPNNHYFLIMPPTDKPCGQEVRDLYQAFFKDWAENSGNVSLQLVCVEDMPLEV